MLLSGLCRRELRARPGDSHPNHYGDLIRDAAHADHYTDTDRYTDPHLLPDQHADSYADSYADGDGYANPNSYPDALTDQHTDLNVNAHIYPDADLFLHPYAYIHFYPVANGYFHQHGDAKRNTDHASSINWLNGKCKT